MYFIFRYNIYIPMFGNMLQKAASVGKRMFGTVGQTLRKFADTTGQVVRKVGNFVVDNHQPISMLPRAVGDATSNETLKNVGSAAMATSAYLTTKGVGKDYTGLRRMLEPAS
jgi:hypothetical protein